MPLRSFILVASCFFEVHSVVLAQPTASASPPVPEARCSSSEAIVAQTSGVTVTAGEITQIINSFPPVERALFSSIEAQRSLAAAVLRERVLAREARRQDLDEDLLVRRAVDQVLARALEERSQVIRVAAPTEAQLRAFYDSHLPEYLRPERVKIQAIRARDEAHARRIIRVAGRSNERRFERLAERETGASRTWLPGSDVGWVIRGGRVDSVVAQAAFALERIGSVAARPIRAGDGAVYVLRLAAREAEELPPFETMRAALESRWRAERQAEARMREVERLAGGPLRILLREGQVFVEPLPAEVPNEEPDLQSEKK